MKARWTVAGRSLEPTPGDAWDVTVSEGYAYVAAGTAGVVVFDVSDPEHPTQIGIFATPAGTLGVALEGGYAYVADTYSGLRVLDTSDPAMPVEVGYYDTPGDAFGVALDGGFAYVADGTGGSLIVRYVARPEEE